MDEQVSKSKFERAVAALDNKAREFARLHGWEVRKKGLPNLRSGIGPFP
jgi:hypothetical protein